jgi:hypothetical protein
VFVQGLYHSSVSPLPSNSLGCGTRVHAAVVPREGDSMWIGLSQPHDVVVPLEEKYFDDPSAGHYIDGKCGCQREGLGCSVWYASSSFPLYTQLIRMYTAGTRSGSDSAHARTLMLSPPTLSSPAPSHQLLPIIFQQRRLASCPLLLCTTSLPQVPSSSATSE